MGNSISLLGTPPKVEFSTFDLSDTKIKKLIISAIDIRNRGNQPVSGFHVGAAIQVQGCDKEIYVGANLGERQLQFINSCRTISY